MRNFEERTELTGFHLIFNFKGCDSCTQLKITDEMTLKFGGIKIGR